MNTSEDWDVEQYKAEHESDEHWELRKKFLLTHRNRFPEEELFCLAQVFINVEVLGCRYPQETMSLIADLAQEVVGEYREKQKHKLQRTFVKASDAATNKAKGTSASCPREKGRTESDKSNLDTVESDTENVPAKKIKLDEAPFGDIILVERPGDAPQTILSSAVNACGSSIEWKMNKIDDSWQCIVLINSTQLSEAYGQSQKIAKKEASLKGLQRLQKQYYTIKVKHFVGESTDVSATEVLQNTSQQEFIPNDNIGIKLMKLMGWTGGGLGKSQQGIVEPIVLKQQVNRDGLGLKMKSYTLNDLKAKCKDILKKYLMEDTKNDLVFSPDFSNEERAAIHQLARQMGLKSHSYGAKDQRRLVISRKIDIKDLVAELKSLGGSTDKYELIKPSST